MNRPVEPRQDEEAQEDRQEIKRLDAQRATDPEGPQADPAVSMFLAEQERRDQIAAEDEEQLNAGPAVLLDAIAQIPRRSNSGEYALCGSSRLVDPAGKLRHAVVKDEDPEKGEEPQPVQFRIIRAPHASRFR